MKHIFNVDLWVHKGEKSKSLPPHFVLKVKYTQKLLLHLKLFMHKVKSVSVHLVTLTNKIFVPLKRMYHSMFKDRCTLF